MKISSHFKPSLKKWMRFEMEKEYKFYLLNSLFVVSQNFS